MKKDKRTKKEKLVMYLKGVLQALDTVPEKAINKENAIVIAKSVIEICS